MKKNKSIQSSLFLTYSLIILVVIGMFVSFFYLWESNLLKTQALKSIYTLSDSFQEKLDLEIKNIDTVSMNVEYSNLVKESFSKYINQTDKNNTQSDTTQLLDILMAINGPSLSAKQINLYDFKGRTFGAGFDNKPKDVDVTKKEWYTEVLSKDGRKVLSSPFKDPVFSNMMSFDKNKYFISLCRLYFNEFGNTQGIIEVRQFYDTIFKSIAEYSQNNPNKEKILVYNDSGKIIYPVTDKPDTNNSYYYKLYTQKSKNSPYLIVTNPKTKVKEMLVNKRSEYTGWIITVVVSYNELLSPVFSFEKITIFATITIIFFALAFSFFAAKKYTRPISRLRSLIKSMDLQNPSIISSPIELNSGLYELEDLNHAFHKMNIKVKKSVEDLLLAQHNELLSKMLALQSQMNPHFLYNTLATISAMSEENMNEQISKMCGYLSDLLRYISSDKAPMVKIDTEINYTRKFLACMKFRFGNKLSYTIEIDDELNEIQIPKLIIQPLVENALKYGTTKEPPWNIKINGYISNQYWLINIKDNGAGFDQEKVDQFNQRIREIEQDGLLPSLELDGMGLLSIYIKLKLVYKTQKIFTIAQAPDGGAFITIGGSLG